MTTGRADPEPFQDHLQLLQAFLHGRTPAVEGIQELLNAQRLPVALLEDRPRLLQAFEDVFFALPGLAPALLRLRGRLLQAHRATGFRPTTIDGLHNDLADPAEMLIRSFRIWRQTRWPGRNGRLRQAQMLFNLYLVRCLALLAMRALDAESEAGARLAAVQALLDRLWLGSPADQPVLVRDARWLLPLAQSPANEELGPYFEVAERIDARLPAADRIEAWRAAIVLAGGHLRSQLRHYNMQQGVPLGNPGLVLSARRSNALDFALTLQGLVPLLAAYGQALQDGDDAARRRLAGAICQGISPDPELFVNRLDLLGPYSMIEGLFVCLGRDGNADLTTAGRRHVRLLAEYAALIGRLASPLLADCVRLAPAADACSPYGVIYGFSYHLLEHMAFLSLVPGAVSRYTLEDVFDEAGDGRDKLAWVSAWRQLPHISAEVRRLYAYPAQFAHDVFGRVEAALRQRASGVGAAPTGRLRVAAGEGAGPDTAAALPALPVHYVLSSDPAWIAAGRAESCDEARLRHDRLEGMYLVGHHGAGGWIALSKDLLTQVLGAGRDVGITGLPPAATAVLEAMCRGLAVVTDPGRTGRSG